MFRIGCDARRVPGMDRRRDRVQKCRITRRRPDLGRVLVRERAVVARGALALHGSSHTCHRPRLESGC